MPSTKPDKKPENPFHTIASIPFVPTPFTFPAFGTATFGTITPNKKCELCGTLTQCKLLNTYNFSNTNQFVLQYVFNKNTWETKIMNQIIASKGATLDGIVKNCLTELDNNKYTYHTKTSTGNNIKSTSDVCLGCAQNIFNHLVYQYRVLVPDAELPNDGKSRPDCWYGSNCNLQQDFMHCKKYNHILVDRPSIVAQDGKAGTSSPATSSTADNEIDQKVDQIADIMTDIPKSKIKTVLIARKGKIDATIEALLHS